MAASPQGLDTALLSLYITGGNGFARAYASASSVVPMHSSQHMMPISGDVMSMIGEKEFFARIRLTIATKPFRKSCTITHKHILLTFAWK